MNHSNKRITGGLLLPSILGSLLALGIFGAGCIAPVSDSQAKESAVDERTGEAPQETAPLGFRTAAPASRASAGSGTPDEQTAEAQEAVRARDVCIAAVLYGAALGCGAATLACTGATVLTVGSMILPCSYVLVGACVVAPAGASVYAATLCEAK